MQNTFFSILLFIFFGYSNFLFAGWVIVEESSDSFGNHNFQTTFIQQNKVRVDGITTVNVLDLKKKELTLIFPSHRSYWKGTPGVLNYQTNQLIKKQFQTLLLRAPSSQKEQLRKLIRDLDSTGIHDTSKLSIPLIQIIRTEKKEIINGFHTIKYRVLIDNVLKETLWVSFDQSPYNEIDVEQMLSFTRSINPNSLVSLLSHSADYVKLLKNGMLIKSIDYHKHGIKEISQVKEIKKMEIGNDLFLPPAGYRRATIEEIMQMDMNMKLPGGKINFDNPDDKNGIPQLPTIKK